MGIGQVEAIIIESGHFVLRVYLEDFNERFINIGADTFSARPLSDEGKIDYRCFRLTFKYSGVCCSPLLMLTTLECEKN